MDPWMVFLMLILSPIANGIVGVMICMSGYNARRSNKAVGWCALALFAVIGLGISMITTAPTWIMIAGILFWIGWRRLGKSLVVVEVASSLVYRRYDCMICRYATLVKIVRQSAYEVHLIETPSFVPVGKYLPHWDGMKWKFNPMLDPTTTH
jgi:chromate transport protein ChrA